MTKDEALQILDTIPTIGEQVDALEMAIQALELDYKTAFQIACALLNGDILYGVDAESIFSEIMKKDGCVCSFDYENYILTHLNELRDDKALPQEPCDDVVSRILTRMWNCRGKHTTNIDKVAMEQIIRDELPPVIPQQKYGKWIEHPEIETSAPEYLMFYECSECGDKQCFCKSDIYKKRFCNNCGAKMVEPQESEDKKWKTKQQGEK